MNVPITFPPISGYDASDEPLIVEADIKGYLIHRIFVDEGAAIQVMFEHYFNNLCLSIRARLAETQKNLVGFLGEELTPLGKIDLEVSFGIDGLKPSRVIEEVSSGNNPQSNPPAEEIMVNPAFPDQLVIIGRQFSKKSRLQVIDLLRSNKDLFA
ncbi:hypothetical protein Tco_1322950 [Tanacetum coccineum]